MLGLDNFFNRNVENQAKIINENELYKIPMLTLEQVQNYNNIELYEYEKALRKYLNKVTGKKKPSIRTSARLLFCLMHGRQPEPQESAKLRLLNILLRYYATSKTGATTIKGERQKSCYRFKSGYRLRRKPYSLRLYMEWQDEKRDSKNN